MLARTKHVSTGRMLRQEVVTPDMEHLGEIVELMMDVNYGIVAYAVLSFGGKFMGAGNKLFAVPWQKISLLKADSKHEGHMDRKFMIDVPKELLKAAPGFDRDNWPDTGDIAWLERVYVYYDCPPYWL